MFTSLFQLEQKPVTVFSASDAGAPVLTADPGSLKTLLKACLVTGYGSKQALGWQMAFESTDKNSAAFKSADPTSSGFYFKINNSATGTAKLSAYQTMTDINTGSNELVVDNSYSLKASAWKLIGHSKAFILLCDVSTYNGKFACPILFGDLPREKKRVEPLCVLWCARGVGDSGGLQQAVFMNPKGSDSTAPTYPVVVNNMNKSYNINSSTTTAVCRFTHSKNIKSTALYEPILENLPDGSWTFIPMLQPLSVVLTDVVNLGAISGNTIRAKTGDYQSTGFDNSDCAVPLDWWYA